MNLNVACVQLSSCEDIDKNVKSLQRLVKKNLNKKIDLICLPECSPILTDSIKVIRENFTNGKLDYFLDIIKEMSISLQTYILIGSMPFKKAKNRYLNRSILFDRNGNQVCWYDKINLFDVVLSKNESYRESKNYD